VLIARWSMERTEQELNDASEHVKYEIPMLKAMMSLLSESAEASA
jgi:hypothetical protein